MRVAVLASGTGTILSSLIEQQIPIALVVVDRACPAEKIAEHAGIAVEVVARSDFSASFDRVAYGSALSKALVAHDIELIVLAGFGTILDAGFIGRYPSRIVNTHPSLLPSFKGWHAVRDTLAAGVKVTGCTVHFVTAEVDEGPILAQEPVRIAPGETEASLHERIKEVERVLFPRTIKELLSELDRSGG